MVPYLIDRHAGKLAGGKNPVQAEVYMDTFDEGVGEMIGEVFWPDAVCSPTSVVLPI